jgi:hypothetical protein
MSDISVLPSDPTELRPLLHADIDRLPDEQLGLAHRLLMEIELEQLTAELDGAADKAHEEGKLTPEGIHAAIAAHRAERPYR